MAILYDWYENPGESNDSEEKGLHPRIFLNGKVGTDKLCRMIHGRSSLSVGDVKNAFEMLAQICGEELREGREVHIEGLGYFAPILRSTQKVTRSTKNKWLKMELKTIGFRPDARLRGELRGAKVSRSKYARHSESLSAVEIDMRLKEYFADHDVMLRYDFQEVCCMTRTTANRHLRRLLEEGKLKNIGKRMQPIYVASAGYYGVSRDVLRRYYLKCVGETFESRMEGLFMVAFTRFPALGGGFRKKVKAVKDVVL